MKNKPVDSVEDKAIRKWYDDKDHCIKTQAKANSQQFYYQSTKRGNFEVSSSNIHNQFLVQNHSTRKLYEGYKTHARSKLSLARFIQFRPFFVIENGPQWSRMCHCPKVSLKF